MKLIAATFAALSVLSLASLPAATPEQEKAFVDSYRKALEAGDTKTLESFLYTKGATEETVEFFKMMQAPEPGMTITEVRLDTPTAEEIERKSKPQEMPDGKLYKMPLKVSKQLVIVSETKSDSGSSKSTRKAPVAEFEGRLVIPVPVPVSK